MRFSAKLLITSLLCLLKYFNELAWRPILLVGFRLYYFSSKTSIFLMSNRVLEINGKYMSVIWIFPVLRRCVLHYTWVILIHSSVVPTINFEVWTPKSRLSVHATIRGNIEIRFKNSHVNVFFFIVYFEIILRFYDIIKNKICLNFFQNTFNVLKTDYVLINKWSFERPSEYWVVI